MAFEKSAITDNPSAIPTQSPIQMREDREVDPYRHTKIKTETVAFGQKPSNNNNSEQVTPGEVPPVAEEALKLSPAAAALARQEQKIRQRELDIKKRELAIEAERAEIAEVKALKAKWAAKDYSDIEKQVPYDEYTQYLINKETQLTPEQKAIKELSEKVAGVENSHKEDIEKRFEAAVNERKKAVTNLIQANNNFPIIKELKAEEHVVKHILDTWEHDEIDLSPEEAAREVEEVLSERANKWSTLAQLTKKLDPAEATPPEDKKVLPPLKAPIKTLTNNMAAPGEIKRPQKPLGNMSDQERWAEARRRAEEKLSKGIRQ